MIASIRCLAHGGYSHPSRYATSPGSTHRSPLTTQICALPRLHTSCISSSLSSGSSRLTYLALSPGMPKLSTAARFLHHQVPPVRSASHFLVYVDMATSGNIPPSTHVTSLPSHTCAHTHLPYAFPTFHAQRARGMCVS